MIPIQSISRRDVEQWVNNGWVAVEGGVLSVAGVSADESDRVLLLGTKYSATETGSGISATVRADQCHAHWPVLGAVNVESWRKAVSLCRLSKKSYKRTYNHRAVVVFGDNGSSRAANVPEVVVQLFYGPAYPPYSEALRMLNDGWESVALSRSVTIHGDSQDFDVKWRNILIGRVIGGVGSFTIQPPVLDSVTKLFEGGITVCQQHIGQ